MADTFKFELVSPERVLMSVDAEQALIPGAEGDFTVLVGHAPLVSTLRPGDIQVKVAGSDKRVFVKGGIAEVEPTGVTVLTQMALDLAQRDAARIAEEIALAEKEVAEAKDDYSRTMAELAVAHLKSLGAAA